MRMNEKKVCFISCINNKQLYNEVLYYINQLEVPEGYEIECISVENAESMAEGYNKAMNESDAKYKVYLHQDVYIINKFFIKDFLNIFNSDKKIGIIGMVGTKIIPTTGIWWESKQKYGKVYDSHSGNMQLLTFNEVLDEYEEVQAIDGLLMITQEDIKWREDLFDGWHFYDLSQSLEFLRCGYYVVVPRQNKVWCIHDFGDINTGYAYERLRNIFLDEYNEYIVKILLEKIKNKTLESYESVIQWRKYYIESKNKKQILDFIDESIINSLKVETEKTNELFEFDKIKALEVMLSNREKFLKYLKNANILLNNKNYEQAALLCFEGAKFASENHPGFYVSQELEIILLECSNNLPNKYKEIKVPKKNSNKRNVLHIISEGYPTGGHTRLVKNWIEKDKESIHSLIATWQINSTPDWLIETVKKSGGWIESLKNIESFLERAISLRKAAYEWADIIVLHIHMFDVIPIMAFGVEGGPPIVFMNHADHVFWIGNSISDDIINFRDAGKDLTLRRRNTNRNSILPLPLSLPIYNKSIENFRESLGISEDSIVLLTIATPYKFKSFGSTNYIDIMNKVLERYKNVITIVIGPSKMGIWEEANKKTSNRLRPLGIQKDIYNYYSIADIYIDSFMIGSTTSALDAGIYGIPVVALQNYNNKTLSFNDVAYRKDDLEFNSIEKYVNYIGGLINSIDYRKSEGEKLSLQIKKSHVYRWNHYVESIYLELENIEHKIFLNRRIKNEIGNEDLFLAMFQSSIYNK